MKDVQDLFKEYYDSHNLEKIVSMQILAKNN